MATHGFHTPTVLWAVFAVLMLNICQVSAEDHPLLSRYEGSELLDRKVTEFDSYRLVISVSDQGEFSGKSLQGKITRLVYQNPAGRSTLEVFENYRNALAAEGLELIYSCALDDCGPAYARSSWNRYNGLFVAADGDPRYLSGKLSTPDGTAYVALMVGKRRTQVDVIDMLAMHEGKVIADAGALAHDIARYGKVSVYRIHFDIDKTEIRPDSEPALTEIATLLRQQPELMLYVVGHTDMTGSLQHNKRLSDARAKAVVRILVAEFGISPQRLEGYGVGPLAPVAANVSDIGRAKNRRVELVAR